MDIIEAGGSITVTIDGASYTLRRLLDVQDTIVYRGGELKLCSKINDAGTELRGAYKLTVIPCTDLSAVIKAVELPCRLADLMDGSLEQVSYADCGAYLDGSHDDYEAMYRAHYIGKRCGCKVYQHAGIIYKANSEWLYVNGHDVDLTGCSLKIDGYNRTGTYWLGGQTYYTTDGLDKSEVKRYATVWPSAETGYRANGLFILTRPGAATRWNDGVVTQEDQKEMVRHGMDGRVYSPVIDDATEDTEILFTRYPERRQSFKGCTLDIDIPFASVAMYFMRVERSNVTISDFILNPTRRTTQNSGYRGAAFTLNNCADITLENIKGINIAGRPTTSYPRGVAGYVLNAVCVLDLTVRDCNLLGYWGCVGLNGAKEITFDGCELNRVDIHDYFANVTINNCRIYGQTLNFGYGRGALNISNCHILTDWVHQVVNLRCDYGRYFEGEINLANVTAVYTGTDHFDLISGVTMFSAESAAGSGLYMERYPTINASNVVIRCMGESYAGYVFNMPADLEQAIEVADKQKVIEYSGLTVYDADGSLLVMDECPITAYIAKSPYICKRQLADAIICDAQGSEIVIDDAAAGRPLKMLSVISEGEGDITLTRSSKNVLALSDYDATKTGVRITYSGNVLTLDGVSTASSTQTTAMETITLPAGSYVMSYKIMDGHVFASNDSITMFFAQVGSTYYRLRANDDIVTFTLQEETGVKFGCMIAANGAEYRRWTATLQLEAGTAATDHTPYDSTTLKTTLPAVTNATYNWLTGELETADGIVQLTPHDFDLLQGSNILTTSMG